MKAKKIPEQTKLWRLPLLGNLEMLHATYVTHTFSRHAHQDFAVGIIEKGALKFSYRGANLVASSGCINLANPGEAHNGYAASDRGWTYRMFYLDPLLLQQAASEIVGRPKDIPFFQAGVIQDKCLAGHIHNLHILLEKPGAPLLEQESQLLWTLAQFIVRHADDRHAIHSVGKESQVVSRVREYIEDHYAEDISINQLSRIANLSPFHLIRVFGNQVGIPPHAYLMQVRVTRVKEFLAQGWPIAQVTFAAGFVDQSHLTRQFKRIVGVTPGQYSNIIQDYSK